MHLSAFSQCYLDINAVKDYKKEDKEFPIYHQKYLRLYSYDSHLGVSMVTVNFKNLEYNQDYHVQVVA